MNRFGACRVYTNLGDYQSSKHLHWHIGCGTQLRPYCPLDSNHGSYCSYAECRCSPLL
jgi:hypothetical protein